MEKLLIVDGSNLLFQMFYGMPARIIGKHGKSIHGTIGFVGALLKILKITAPTHAVVLFDGECRNNRCDLDEAYKTNRPNWEEIPEEETPFSQLPDIFASLDCLKIPYAETTSCETDDWIASYIRTLGDKMKIVVSSFDSDFFQLITDNVTVLRYRGENTKLCDVAFVREKFGIEPSQYADFKCLVGDTADNVTGIRGIGPKTAGKLVRDFGSIDGILAHLDEVQPLKIRLALSDGVERLKLNRRLIALTGNAEIPYSIEAIRYQESGKTTGQVLSEIGIR